MNAWLHEIAALASALATADRTGMLVALAAQPITAQATAEKLGLDARATAIVLQILSAHGLVIDKSGVFEPSDALRSALADELSEPARATALWLATESFVRTGRSAEHVLDAEQRGAVYSRFVPHLGRKFELAARQLAEHLASDLGERSAVEVLDIGAGSGAWSLALAERIAGSAITALDLSEVLCRFRERADALRLGHRTRTIAGDYMTVKLPADAFDVVLVANVLHLEPAARAAEVLARAATCLRPGGRLVVVDMFPDGSPAAARVAASYALHLALRLPGGSVHTRELVDKWFCERGLLPVRRFALDAGLPGMAALIAARRTD